MTLDTSIPISSVTYNGVDVPLFQEAPVLLWENASPTSVFNPQTITVATGYDAYMIEYRYSISDASSGITYYDPARFKTDNIAFSAAGVKYMALSCYFAGRKMSPQADGELYFSTGFNGYLGTMAGAYSEVINSDENGIPTRIWGVKFTL